ncbi:MAG: hypothetical protein K0V04_24325 [Deltaproteobacteria bacterium]|nr:hypothetical protein [Deltaproteobacteria bacterium]
MPTHVLFQATIAAAMAAARAEPSPAPAVQPVAARAPAVDTPRPAARRAMKVGGGMMAGGGVLMVVGAGVLLPLGVAGAVSARPPDPTTYTAIEPFRDDLIAYQRSVSRSMKFGVAGAVTGVVGAVTFATGALTWGVGRRRWRRAQLSMSITPSRTGVRAGLVGRF